MVRQYAGVIVRLVLSIALLALLGTIIDFRDLLSHFVAINWSLYALGLVAFLAFVALWALRWHVIIQHTAETIRYFKALTTLLTGIFFSMFLPSIVGTDVGRVVELSRERHNQASAISSVLIDRVVGLLNLVLMALVALIVGGAQFVEDQMIVVVIVGTLVAMAVGWFLFFNRRFMRLFERLLNLPIINRFEASIRELYDALYALHNQPRLLISTVVISVIAFLCEIASVMLAAAALGIAIEPAFFFIFMPIIWVIITIPVTISGLGLREGVFVFFFGQIGVDPAHAVALSLVYYTFSVVTGVVGGLIFLRFSVTEFRAKLSEQRAG